MDILRRVAVLKFAAQAYEFGLNRVNGELSRDENGRWLVGTIPLENWLNEHEGQEVVVVMGSLQDNRPAPPRTCRTCGRDYTDLECPHCRANRVRLRGRP
jgi:hypothetical protein